MLKKTLIYLLLFSILIVSFCVNAFAYSATTSKYDYSKSVYPFDSMTFTTQESPNSLEVQKAYDFPTNAWEYDPNTFYYDGVIKNQNQITYDDYNVTHITNVPIYQYDGNTDGIIYADFSDVAFINASVTYPLDYNLYIQTIHGYIYSGSSSDAQIPYENRGTVKLWINDGEYDREFITYGANGYQINYPYLYNELLEPFSDVLNSLHDNNAIDELTYYVLWGILVNNSENLQFSDYFPNTGDGLKFNYTVSETMDDLYFRKHYTFTLDRFKHGRNRGYNGSYSYKIDFKASEFYTNYDNSFSGVILKPSDGWYGSIHVERLCAVRYTVTENYVDENGNAFNVLRVETKYITEFEDFYFNDESPTTQALITPVPTMWDIDGFFNADMTILSWAYCNIGVTIIPDRVSVNTPNRPENLTLTMIVWYDEDTANFDGWFRQQSGDFFQPLPDRPNVTDTDFIQWLSKTTGGFLNTQLFGGITLGQIIWFAIGVGIFFALLKYFVGG